MIAALERAARGLLPPGVAVAATDPRAAPPPAFPAEKAALARMAPARQREFRAGRAAIRAAMRSLGLPPAAVPMGPDRAPLWPAGLVGSLTHVPEACLAALAPAPALRGIGIDLERTGALAEELWEGVLGERERDWLRRQPDAARPRLATALFSAKEAAYKCQYPLSRRLLGFDAMRIALDPDLGRFSAEFRVPAPPFAPGDRLAGQVAFGPGWVLTAVILRGASGSSR